jgi:hypothetical protein
VTGLVWQRAPKQTSSFSGAVVGSPADCFHDDLAPQGIVIFTLRANAPDARLASEERPRAKAAGARTSGSALRQVQASVDTGIRSSRTSHERTQTHAASHATEGTMGYPSSSVLTPLQKDLLGAFFCGRARLLSDRRRGARRFLARASDDDRSMPSSSRLTECSSTRRTRYSPTSSLRWWADRRSAISWT